MKVQLIIPSLKTGGAERVLSILANSWTKKTNVDVEIVLLTKGPSFYHLDPSIKITELGFAAESKAHIRVKSIVLTALSLRAHIKEQKPDFVLSFMTKFNVFVLLTLIGLRTNVVVSERDSPSEDLPLHVTLLRRLLYKHASGIICQTQDSQHFIEKSTTHNNVTAIPNPIQTPILSNEVTKSQKVILNVGRLHKKKGQRDLIRAFGQLDNDDWQLWFVGDGPLRDNLLAEVQRLELQNRVFFLGTTKNVSLFLQQAEIFAFPSLWEGFPNALAEAMAHGVACVSYDCPTGPSDIIEHEVSGLLVPVGNVELLAHGLQRLIHNPDLRRSYGDNAKFSATKLDSEHVSDRYFTFCQESTK